MGIPIPLFQSECFSTRQQTSRDLRARSSLVLAGKFLPLLRPVTPGEVKLRPRFRFIGKKTLFNSSYSNTTLLESDDYDMVKYQISDFLAELPRAPKAPAGGAPYP